MAHGKEIRNENLETRSEEQVGFCTYCSEEMARLEHTVIQREQSIRRRTNSEIMDNTGAWTHLMLEGEDDYIPRIRVGDVSVEAHGFPAERFCFECGTVRGKPHAAHCGNEPCPRCFGVLTKCEHEVTHWTSNRCPCHALTELKPEIEQIMPATEGWSAAVAHLEIESDTYDLLGLRSYPLIGWALKTDVVSRDDVEAKTRVVGLVRIPVFEAVMTTDEITGTTLYGNPLHFLGYVTDDRTLEVYEAEAEEWLREWQRTLEDAVIEEQLRDYGWTPIGVGNYKWLSPGGRIMDPEAAWVNLVDIAGLEVLEDAYIE